MKKPPVVRKCAFPMRLTHSQRPPKAVLLIHGYAGYPGELALAASSLYEAGCDVVVPRLAGHGTNGADFCLTNRHNWLGCVEVELQNMLSMYEEVSLVGHSMGAAIAVLLMAAYSVGPSVVLAPALEIPALNHAAVSLLSLFVKDKKVAWQPDPRYRFFDQRDEDDDLYLGSEYWSHLYFKQLRQLSLLRKEALGALHGVTTDLLVITGDLDETIGKEVGKVITQKIQGKSKHVRLAQGTHFLPYDIDDEARQETMRLLVDWIVRPLS